MKILASFGTTCLNFEFKRNFYIAQGATYDKLFIFKHFSKCLYKKNYIFDYLFFIKFIVNYIIIVGLTMAEIFDDFSRYAFKSGIFKQSYFSLYIRFKKRNANWYHLLYANL